jgi:glycosyltransferase involved in cell wall biosynthesis
MSVTKQKDLTPKVSILIPVSGNPVYLSQTIESIISQTYKNFEVIIVLNNADEWAKSYLRVILEQDKRFTVMCTVEKGISNALNVGLGKIKNSFVCRIDSDDLMEPRRIEKQVKFLLENPDIGVVGSQVKRINEEGCLIGASNFPTNTNDVKDCLTIRNPIAHPSVMFRRELVDDVAGYQSQFDGAEDYDLWLRLRDKTRLANINECLTSYRVWPKQETSRNAYLTRQLTGLLHAHQFSKLKLEFSSSDRASENIKDFSKRYYYYSITKLMREFHIQSLLRLVGIHLLDSGIQMFKFNNSFLLRCKGLILISLGFPFFVREIIRCVFLPTLHGRLKNATH